MKQKNYFIAQITSSRVFESALFYKGYQSAYNAAKRCCENDEEVNAVLIFSKDSHIVIKRKMLLFGRRKTGQ